MLARTFSRATMENKPGIDRDQPASRDDNSSPENPNNKKLKMICASFYVPKHDDLKPLGEDAHFVCEDAETIGVADGVGGWAKRGIDSGKYARELMNNAILAVVLRKDQAEAVDLGAVLRQAYRRTTEAEVKGSSTACLVSHSDGILRSANVGDSGFMIFRQNLLLYRSKTQQRGFNCPYQLGESKRCDRPGCAVERKIKVAAGDVVVLGTDGFLDNVFPREVEKILVAKSGKKSGVDAAELACMVARISLHNSLDSLRDTPFSKEAKLFRKSHRGGKIDDITVVVGLIVNHDTTATN